MKTNTHSMIGVTLWMGGDTILRLLGMDLSGAETLFGVSVVWFMSKAPDIDNPHSAPGHAINRMVPGLSDTINWVGGHRGPTHWISTGLAVSLILGLLAVWISPLLWWVGAGTAIGWVSHVVGDCCTYRGVRIFGPFGKNVVRLPYGFRFESGGRFEVQVIAPLISIFMLAVTITWFVVVTD